MFTLFQYQYRDAANFKAFGRLILKGALTSDDIQSIRAQMSGDGLFIAEQLHVPPLYEQLYQWSHGPTQSDHCWHEFVDIRVVDEVDRTEAVVERSAKEFAADLLAIDTWDEELSPHFRLCG